MMFLSLQIITKALLLWLIALALYTRSASADQLAEEEARMELEQGIHSLQEGQTTAACQQFKSALAKDPKLSEAYIYLGIAENQRQRFADAVLAFRSAIRLNDGSEAVRYNLALSLLGLRKIDEATLEFREVVKLNAGNESALYNLALLLEQQGSFTEACKYLESARSLQPNDPAVWVHLTDVYLKLGNDAGALQLLRQSSTVDSDGTLSMQIGKLLVERNHFKEALLPLENAEKFVPSVSQNTNYLARAYLGVGQPARVLSLLARIGDGDASWEIFDLRGSAAMALGRREDAAHFFSKALEMHPAEAFIHYHLGQLLLTSPERSERTAGENEISEAISLDPAQAEFYLTLGSYYFDAGSMKATINLLTSALTRVPPSLPMYVTLGLAELELHGPAEAEPFIQKAIALDPQAGAGYDLLGRCRMRLDDYADAAKYYRKAAQLTPQNHIYFRDAAIALDKLGNSREALAFAEQSVRLRPSDIYNHYILGKLYSQVGEKSDAIRELETCVTLNPRNALPYNLLASLYKRAGEDAKAADCWRALRDLKQRDAEKEERTFLRLESVPQ